MRSDKAKQELEERLGEKERVLKDVQVSFDDHIITLNITNLATASLSIFSKSLRCLSEHTSGTIGR